MRPGLWLLAGAALIAGGAMSASPGTSGSADPAWQAFIAAGGQDRRQSEAALDEIGARWRDAYATMLVEVARFLPSPQAFQQDDEPRSFDADVASQDPASRSAPVAGARAAGPSVLRRAENRRRLTSFLERHTRQRFGDDLRAWRRWMWSVPYAPHPDYALFKAELYSRIDRRLGAFFPPGAAASIRLDEVDWGGVAVNGIPPLRAPKTLPADKATWLRDDHIIFGVQINGEARAYPKRILAWHEMATDRLGGIDLTVVYCTLCGTVIPYESSTGARRFTFGTSGLLYRSNKLMFDEETMSLWSSLEGVPVVGPLVGGGLRLRIHAVVTTTWKEWRRDHPSTTVLSLETGHERNYAEGAAYRDYFATDRLMFEVPMSDARLRNKAEVLVLRPEILGAGASPVAIAVDRLRREPVFAFDAAGRGFVVVTSRGGANRVYERGVHAFAAGPTDGAVVDANGRRWIPADDALVGGDGERMARIPAHRAFWFGWVAQHPQTVLHK